jgi:flagellar biosynthesis/type III secretory pathway protein FliH
MRTVHWLLALPEEEELGFRKDVKEMEASMQTKDRSPYERIVWNEGLEKGLETGRAEGRLTAAREMLLEMIHARFGPCKEAFRARIEAIQDEGQLWQLARAVLSVSSPAELESRFPG